MSRIELINASCADQKVDAVVNAANSGLWAGGGICGVIFAKAGMAELTEACRKIGTPLDDGDAVITPAFALTNAKAIIHAVGPNFAVTPGAFDKLYKAYYNSLLVLMENGLHSISFPLISSGIFGGSLPDPAGESAKQCFMAYNAFTADHPEYEIESGCAPSRLQRWKRQKELYFFLDSSRCTMRMGKAPGCGKSDRKYAGTGG